MNAQQLSRRHVMQLAAGAVASAGLVRASLAASGSDARVKAIIIYFSRTGTTKGLAEAAAAATGADLLELTLKDPYADDYSAMTGIARSERANRAAEFERFPFEQDAAALDGLETDQAAQKRGFAAA